MNAHNWVKLLYGDVMGVVASTVRGGITAPPGKKLVVSDLASIESRVLGWVSGCKWINDIFANGKDTYRTFATELFHCAYDEVTKEQRNYSKPPFLGCGYRLAGKGLMKYAEDMGVTMSGKEAKTAVRIFREKTPEISDPRVGLWAWLDQATKKVVTTGGRAEGFHLSMWRDEQFLIIKLPSRRLLYYYQPWVEKKTITITDPETNEEREWTTPTVTYMGQHTKTRQWVRLTTHGGKTTENIIQALSRDILAGV